MRKNWIVTKHTLDLRAKIEFGDKENSIENEIKNFRYRVSLIRHINCPNVDKFLLAFLRHAKYEHFRAETHLDKFCTFYGTKNHGQCIPWMVRETSVDDLQTKYFLEFGFFIPLGYDSKGTLHILLRFRNDFEKIEEEKFAVFDENPYRVIRSKGFSRTENRYSRWGSQDQFAIDEPYDFKSISRSQSNPELSRLKKKKVSDFSWNDKRLSLDDYFRLMIMSFERFYWQEASQIAGICLLIDFEGAENLLRRTFQNKHIFSNLKTYINDCSLIRLKEIVYINQRKVPGVLIKTIEKCIPDKIKDRIIRVKDECYELFTHNTDYISLLPPEYSGDNNCLWTLINRNKDDMMSHWSKYELLNITVDEKMRMDEFYDKKRDKLYVTKTMTGQPGTFIPQGQGYF